MRRKSVCIKVAKKRTETALALVKKLRIIDDLLQIRRDEKSVFIPIVGELSANQVATFARKVDDFQVLTYDFEEREKTEMSIVELLKDRIPPHLLPSLPRATDFVGDIAIVEIPPELEPYKSLIGEAILKTRANVHTVLNKAGAVRGTYRLREFALIAGEFRTETIHKEYGCKFHVNVAKAYFSPRLGYEHRRVASVVEEGETIVDLFAGVGPFAIQIAKTREKVRVYAIDVNPYAIEYLQRNIRINRVDMKVHTVLGDAKEVVRERLSGIADRVVMNLPEKALSFVDVACEALKPSGGIIHLYSFVNASEPLESLQRRFVDAVEDSARSFAKILFSRMVRETAPYEWQAVLDVHIR